MKAAANSPEAAPSNALKEMAELHNTDQELDARLDEAVAAHQAGQHSKAETLYRDILKKAPDQPDALNLLALLKHETGESDDALPLIERAISLAPQSLPYHCNRAAILANLGRFEEAGHAYREAISLGPNMVELYLDLAQVLQETGDMDGAIAALESARIIEPTHDQICVDLARLLNDGGRASEAVTLLEEALGRHPNITELHLKRGQLLQDLYRMDEAAEAYGRAVEIDATQPVAHYKLGRCLAEKGDWTAAIPSYEQALTLDPIFAEAHLYLARALQESGDLNRAIEVCEHAYALRPTYRGQDILLGILFQEAERFEDAAQEFGAAVSRSPDNISVAALAQCQLAAGDAEAAEKTVNQFLRGTPGDTHVLVIQSLILEALGKRDAVRHLVDFDQFMSNERIATPQAFKTLAAFNDALTDHILAHPSLTLSPPRNATRDGYHSGELFAEPMGPFAEFQSVLEEALADYIAKLPDDPNHPFIAGKPKDWWLNAWAIVLDGDGHQISHAHNTAWMSGVYYVQLPDVVDSSGDNPGDDKAGWIEFGPPPPDFPVPLNPETRFIKPEVGNMILFPGYFFHRTVPTGVSQRRISVAFNVIAEPN